MYSIDTFNPSKIKPITVNTEAPSNIALVKYWGKKDNQIPANPSLSFTLSKCVSKTHLILEPKTSKNYALDCEVFFEGIYNENFTKKVLVFFESILTFCPYLAKYSIRIETENSFPHSSGIASSASGMAALAKAICEAEILLGSKLSSKEKDKRASYLARLGSGSAARSIYNGLVLWGKHPDYSYSQDEIATPLKSAIAPIFTHYCDTILLVHKGQKTVSSSAGHNLMHNHPFAAQRFEQAYENINRINQFLIDGNMDGFGALVEREALTLHAMMMTSTPYYILMAPNTLAIINAVWVFRKETNLPVYFTLDAGANVHLLYPKTVENSVKKFIEEQLVPFCEGGQYIDDEIQF